MIPKMASRSVRSGNTRSGASAASSDADDSPVATAIAFASMDRAHRTSAGVSPNHRGPLRAGSQRVLRAQKCIGRAERIGGDAATVGVFVAKTAEVEERIDPVMPELEPGTGGHVAGQDSSHDVASIPYRLQQRGNARQQGSAARGEREFQPLQIAALKPSPHVRQVDDAVLREDLPDDRPIAPSRVGDVATDLLDVEIGPKRLLERRTPRSPGSEQGRIDVEQGDVHDSSAT